MDFQSQYSNQDLAYDLRQRYAKIVGDHLDYISIYRRDKNYPEYFRALEDLYTIVQHKFKEKEIKKVKKKLKDDKDIKKLKKDDDKKSPYETLREELIKTANKYEIAWNGNGKEAEEIAQIENALRAVEKFLLSEMDTAKMFGSKGDTEGLI